MSQMEHPVRRRPYQAVKRAQSARETKRRILQAAHELFMSRGYTATTIAAVAHEAGVVPKTIHLTFVTKAGLLQGLIQIAVAGDDDDLAVVARPEWKEMLDLPPTQLLDELVALVVAVHKRTADLLAVAEVAAASDPELAEARARGRAARAKDFTRLARALAEKRALRPGLSIGEATGSILVLASDATYRTLVDDQRWSTARFQSWLTDMLKMSLLGESVE
jgi:AcrR family transcriptional regulator